MSADQYEEVEVDVPVVAAQCEVVRWKVPCGDVFWLVAKVWLACVFWGVITACLATILGLLGAFGALRAFLG